MLSTRWQPFSPALNQLQQFQGEVNRLFDHWMRGDTSAPAGYPAVNVWEEGDHVHVEAELPGLDAGSLEVFVAEGNQLTLKGERKQLSPGKGVWHRQERGSGAFERTVPLPFLVDANNVDARLENGVLHVQLAKHESARPRKISVKAE